MQKLFLTFLIGLSAIFGGHKTPNQTLGSTYQPARGQTYTLQSSIGTTNTTIALSSFKEPISGIPYTMSYLGTSVAFGTLDPQQPTRAELVSFTGITQNSNGTALLTGVSRGLSNVYPFAASSTLATTHSGQSYFILSDAPQVFAQYPAKVNAETIAGLWTFSSTSVPKLDQNPSFDLLASTTFATIGYVASTSFAGVVNASETVKGISELATGPEAALGTSVGSTAARLVLPASLATSTCQFTQNSVIIASTTTGRIDKGCIDQAANYTFSGSNSFTGTTLFSASSTFSATTSILANSTTTRAFILNGIPYAFPSVQGASSSFLVTNGVGNLSWNARAATGTLSVNGGNSTTTANINLPINNSSITITTGGGTPVLISFKGYGSCASNGCGAGVYATIDGTQVSTGGFDGFFIPPAASTMTGSLGFTVVSAVLSVGSHTVALVLGPTGAGGTVTLNAFAYMGVFEIK